MFCYILLKFLCFFHGFNGRPESPRSWTYPSCGSSAEAETETQGARDPASPTMELVRLGVVKTTRAALVKNTRVALMKA